MPFSSLLDRIRDYLARPRIGDIIDWKIEFDTNSIRFTGRSAPQPIEWRNVRRIAYMTTDGGPFYDHFLVFQLRTPPQWIQIELSANGAIELARYVASLPDTRIGPLGTFANSIENRSVVVWPAKDAGLCIDACLDDPPE